MSNYWATADRVALVAAVYDFADSTTPVVFQPGKPADVKRVIGVITEASAGTSIVTVAVRNVDDTGSTTIGTFTIPASLALNSKFYVELAGVDIDGIVAVQDQASQVLNTDNILFTSLPGVIEVAVGQEMSFTSDGGGTAGMANLYVEYSEQGQDLNSMTKITFVNA